MAEQIKRSVRTPARTSPTRSELAAAGGRVIPDVIAPGLSVLFCGINPGLWSAAVGWHFARPGNRFWPALHRGGFTPRQMHPSEQGELPALGLGITNIVDRATARADELTAQELLEGGRRLRDKAEQACPVWIAVLGVGAYRSAFGNRGAVVGRQSETIGGANVWILPNPSGLNALWALPRLAEAFRELREAADA